MRAKHLCATGLVALPDGGEIIGCSRLGYNSRRVSADVVKAWIEEAKAAGFKSSVCLLNDEQLDYYDPLPAGGLVDAYRAACFEVHHHPVPDHQYPPVPEEVLAQILADARELPQPILVHCSAGVDRTGAVLKYLEECWRPEGSE